MPKLDKICRQKTKICKTNVKYKYVQKFVNKYEKPHLWNFNKNVQFYYLIIIKKNFVVLLVYCYNY